MSNPIKWTAPGTFRVALSCANLASNTRVLSLNYDNNSSGRHDTRGDYELLVKFASAPGTGGLIDLYLIPAVDGINLADGSPSVEPSQDLKAGSFRVQATTSQQRLALRDIDLPPGLFAHLLWNRTGQSTGAVASENQLGFSPYNEEIT